MEKSERKIKWNALASFLLALLLCAGAAGCSDDEDDEPREEEIILRDDWSDTTGEKIAFTLEDEQTKIDWNKTTDEWMVFTYNDGAYDEDYYTQGDVWVDVSMFLPYLYVAISRTELDGYDIAENSQDFFYISAQVTNIGVTSAPETHHFGTITPVIRKAYLTGLKLTND